MAELQPLEGPIDAARTTAAATTSPAAIATVILPASVDTATAMNNNNNNLGASLAQKRQRRPNVRLGEIGDQSVTLSYSSHAPYRHTKTSRFYKDPRLLAAKSSKTPPLTNLVNDYEIPETNNNLDFWNRRPKWKRATTTKRVRTNWTAVNKVDNIGIEGESRDVNKNNEVRDFKPEVKASESPLKEQSPLQSVDNVRLDFWQRTDRYRILESRDRNQDDAVPETSGDRNFGSDSERGRNQNGFLDDRVRNWLIGLGLGSYAAVFEIHEVDDDVLPMLTLEDLKDMGINAVGSRRKLYAAIQKLPKGFS